MFSRVLIYKNHWFLLALVFAFFLLVFPVHAYDVTFSPVGSIIPMCGTGAGTYCSGQSVWNNRTTTAGIGSSTAAHMIFSADTPYFYSDVEYRCSNGGDWGARNYLSSGYISGYNDFSVTWGTSGYNGYVCMFESLADTTNVSYPSGYRREFYYVGGTYDPQQPVASFTVNQSSGVYPLVVQFTDTSSHVPTGWNWNFGGTNTSTSQNPVYTFTEPGTYNVSLTVTKAGFSNSVAYATITVNNYNVPVAAFSCSPTNTTSPAVVTCTDSTSNNPTGWLWHLTSYGVSMSPGGSYGAGIYDAVNSTQNPVFNMEGSGTVDVRLTASNPAGSSQEYKPAYITIAGVAPTPTPTPDIPWPNQTGVCWRSAISLGSQEIREFYVHYQLTDPQGDTYSGQYYPGEINLISGQPFFTAVTGVYIYNEYSMVDNSLLWRQSYVVEDCTITPTPTGTQVFPTPSVTYTVPPTYPTVVIPTAPYTVPTTSVPYPTMTQPSVIQTYPTLSLDFNSSELYNYTITVSPISKPIVSWLRTWIDGYLKTALSSFLALTASPFTYIVSGIPQSTTQLVSGLISFAAYPFAILYAIGVFVRNMPEKVRIVFALLLWSNIVFYYFDFFKRGAR